MSLAAMLWALTEAPVTSPREALYLVAMADYANAEGRGCYASQTTLAAHARVSRRTAQRVQQTLADAGLIVPGDPGLVDHYRPDRRPLVWDLAMPSRGVRLSPRDDDGASEQAPRGVRTGRNGASPVAHNPSTYPSRTKGPVARDGEPDGCAAHGSRHPGCPDCMRTPVGLHKVKPGDYAGHASSVRAALKRKGRP